MAYTPTNWQTGDIVTAEKLNKLENGVSANGGGTLKVGIESDALDKTWKEIHDAMVGGQYAYTVSDGENGLSFGHIANILSSEEHSVYMVTVIDYSNESLDLVQYMTDSENGYPQVPTPPGE